ncbi:MAG TPA: hypothetical protein PK089_09460 [Methanoregulaceae archaeon]|nr:hypothetical protein [Methanoregulaceae archaeon]HQJ86953.1 hypothetical protein [Methanoregulaceae archaeon]
MRCVSVVWLKCIRPQRTCGDEIVQETVFVNSKDIDAYTIRHSAGMYYLLCGNIEQPDYLTVGAFPSEEEAEQCVSAILDYTDYSLLDPRQIVEENRRIVAGTYESMAEEAPLEVQSD